MTETQWRVTWFPPNRPDQSRTSDNEASIRHTAETYAEWAPIIESRTIHVGPWRLEENGAIGFSRTATPDPEPDELRTHQSTALGDGRGFRQATREFNAAAHREGH